MHESAISLGQFGHIASTPSYDSGLQAAGCTLEWAWQVKDFDVSFKVMQRLQGEQGAVGHDIVPLQKHDMTSEVQGNWTASPAALHSHLILVWDNSESLFRGKQVVCKLAVWGN
jgi:hypothetical protein